MFIDHFCVFIIKENSSLYFPLRCIGRLSFPIFCFLLCEGMQYSKNKLKYLTRIISISIITDIFTYIIFKEYYGCALTTLFFGGLTIYFLQKEKVSLKFLAIIPLTIGILTGFDFFPIKMQYGPYGLILILLFYFSKILANYITTSFSNNNSTFINSPYFHYLHIAILTSLFCVYTLLTVYFQNQIQYIFPKNDVLFSIQSYSIISCIFFFLYNGERGYNKKWFKYGCYLFFPLHFILIYLLSLIF